MQFPAERREILRKLRWTVAEILNRKRPLPLEMIGRLHAELEIPAEALVQSIRGH